MPQPPQAKHVTTDDTEHALDKLLGRNTDDFVKKNMEKYDRLVKKWSECSEEEWIAGAEGFLSLYNFRNTLVNDLACYFNSFPVIAEKYAKLTSYVR